MLERSESSDSYLGRRMLERSKTMKCAFALAALSAFVATPCRAATLAPHEDVRGVDVVAVSVGSGGGRWRATSWDDLERTPLEPGRYQLQVLLESAGDANSLRVPVCAGREHVVVDDRELAAAEGPMVVPLAAGRHDVRIGISVSSYERRIACGDPPRVGVAVTSSDGVGVLSFPSPSSSEGGGRAIVYVPPGHDWRAPRPLLVGLHPWNGSVWTYAAYAPLLREARARDVLLLMPSGLGNSLYTASAEDEVLRAIAAASEAIAVDARAVSLWGASMGGAGATTIGFHHPDRFASVTSFFGDSKYDLGTYVRSILGSEAGAHLINALDVVDNAREVPVWLIHGEDDKTSPIRQSEMLAGAMRERGWRVRFDRVPGMGHSGALVTRFLPELVSIAAAARIPDRVERVTYRSVRASDAGAYGVHIVRTSARGDALVDVERRDDAVHVLRAEGIRALVLSRGALGVSAGGTLPIADTGRAPGVDVRWEP